MSSDISALEEELEVKAEARDTDNDTFKKGVRHLSNGIASVGRYFGRRPIINRYVIRPLERFVGGMYHPGERKLVINTHTIRNDPEFAREAGAHEIVHAVQKDTGSMDAYSNGLVRNFGMLGWLLRVPVIEGIASFYTSKIMGRSKDGYSLYRAGATQIAKDHGEYSMINPRYIARNIGGMVDSFLRGVDRYLGVRNVPRLSYVPVRYSSSVK